MKGLANLGNTCYLNAALQCLLYAPPLTNYVLVGLADKDLLRKRINACALATEYFSLTKAYWTDDASKPVLDPRALWTALCKLHRPFANSQPHDAHEALVALLKHLHDALAKTPRVQPSLAWDRVDRASWEAQCVAEGYSMLTEVFQGQLECVVEGPGGYSSTTYEHFTGLSLDLDSCATVHQALVKCLEPVQIEGFKLPDGTIRGVTQTKAFRYPPLVLVLHLKRFEPDGTKIDRFVDYSTDLEVPAAGGLERYSLFGVCFHRDGHYVAACEVNNHWFLLDDSNCTQLEVNSVVQKDAYVLLYKKLL